MKILTDTAAKRPKIGLGLCLLLSALCVARVDAQTLFHRAQYLCQDNASTLAVGDLNGDGVDDFISDNGWYLPSINVFFGNAEGGFRAGGVLGLSEGVQSLELADLNNDGSLDIVAAHVFVGSLEVLLSNGDGTFTLPTSVPLAGDAADLEPIDVNGDGNLDLVASLQLPGALQVLLGDGTGNFSSFSTLPFTSGARELTSGDLNGDGTTDVAVAHRSVGEVSIYLNDGVGNFSLTSAILGLDLPYDVETDDYNADGFLDLAIGVRDAVSVHFGNGLGDFSPSTLFPVATIPSGSFAVFRLASGDINADGNADFIVSFNDAMVSVLTGDGLGSFALYEEIDAGTTCREIAITDVDQDGRRDLLIVDFGTETVLEFRSTPTGFEPAAPRLATGPRPISVHLEDFDGDGAPEMVLSELWSDSLSIYPNDGAGGFGAEVIHPLVDYAGIVKTGDLNGDGNVDLVAPHPSTGYSVLLGDGTGGFSAPLLTALPGTGVSSLVLADFDGNGILDLAMAQYTPVNVVSVLFGTGIGTFSPFDEFPIDRPTALATEDFDGDGFQDLAISIRSSASVSIRLGNGDGTFSVGPSLALADSTSIPTTMAVGDFDADGELDLAVSDSGTAGSVAFFAGMGGGDFNPVQNLATPMTPGRIASGDLSGDGILDVAVANREANNVTVLLGDEELPLQSQTSYQAGQGSSALSIADIDGDGTLDMAVTNYDEDSVMILIGQTIQTPQRDFIRGDANGEGTVDLSDAVFLLTSLYVPTSPAANCPAATDVNRDLVADLSDAVYLLSFLFVPGAPAPPSPYPNCGPDPLGTGLECPASPCP